MNEVYWPAPKVVVVESTYATHYLISRLITPQGLEVLLAGSIAGIREILSASQDVSADDDSRGNIMLFIVGRQLPDGDGLDLIQWVRSQNRWQQVPIILLDHKPSKQRLVDALRFGIDDYIGKPFSEAQFLERLIRLIPADHLAPGEKHPSISQNLFTLLSKEVSRAKRTETKLSLVLADVSIDLNAAKAVSCNDGSLFQRAVKDLFQSAVKSLREVDTVVPFGGKTYAAVLPLAGPDEVSIVKTRLGQAAEPVIEKFRTSAGLEISMNMVSGSYPDNAEDWKGLLEYTRAQLEQEPELHDEHTDSPDSDDLKIAA